jgi:hypothetical protein
MNTPIFVAPPNLKLPHTITHVPPVAPNETIELLRTMVDLQREQVAHARTAAAASDSQSRWRNFLNRWNEEFPGIGLACKESLPVIERTYLRMIQELTNRLHGEDQDDLDSEYVLAEFLDKYGLRLSQLGTIIGQIAPIAEATPPPAPPAEPEPTQ